MAQIIIDISTPGDHLGDPLRDAFDKVNNMFTELYEYKVDKVDGKGLSDNNFTTELQTKLTGIEAGAEVNVQSDLLEANSASDSFIKNKQILGEIGAGAIVSISETPTGTINGINDTFTTSLDFIEGTLIVMLNGLEISEFTEIPTNQFQMTTPPSNIGFTDVVTVRYSYFLP